MVASIGSSATGVEPDAWSPTGGLADAKGVAVEAVGAAGDSGTGGPGMSTIRRQ
ncbi:MAG: hypothetical protein ACKO38_08910 [Planctomycetota bacterium]